MLQDTDQPVMETLTEHQQRAWLLYTKETAGSLNVADFWSELHEQVQKIYLNKTSRVEFN